MGKKEVIEAMIKEAAGIQTFMEEPPTEIAEVLVERLAYANVYIARTGKLLADAKRMLNDRMVEVYEEKGDSLMKVGSTLAQKIMLAYCKDESFLVDWYDRLNRGLVHSADNLRTLISFAKENMRVERFADAVQNRANDGYSEEVED